MAKNEKTFKVKAIMDGHYGGIYRYQGDIFECIDNKKDFSKRWMLRVDSKEEVTDNTTSAENTISNDKGLRIRKALDQLDHLVDAHWTATGWPRIDVVAEISGIKDLTRGNISSAKENFVREIPADGDTDNSSESSDEDQGTDNSN